MYKKDNEKFKLIYAFNGTGKTRLSREFIESEKEIDDFGRRKILYYNSFAEDLFYWDKIDEEDGGFCLRIQPNGFTDWILKDQGKEKEIIDFFQEYTNKKIEPRFDQDWRSVTFSCKLDSDINYENIKISKGEESIFIWSVFFVLLEGINDVLASFQGEGRETSEFDKLEYIFIDDPVSSLDENHLIKLAIDLSGIVKEYKKLPYTKEGNGMKFIITTHNVTFYNVLYNECKCKKGYMLSRNENGEFSMIMKEGDSNISFSYHLHLRELIKKSIKDKTIDRKCLIFLRNLYEKTSSFLGYRKWSALLPEEAQKSYCTRIMNFYSHSAMSHNTQSEIPDAEKRVVEFLFNHINKRFCEDVEAGDE